MHKLAVLATTLAMTACGKGSPSTPTSPGATPAPPPPSSWSVTGQVVSTQAGQPLSGVRVLPYDVMTDDAGTFQATGTGMRVGTRLTLEGPNVLTRVTDLSAATSVPRIDLISVTGFDLGYYRKLARNGFESPDNLQPIRRWTQPQRIYIRSVDEATEPVDTSLLSMAERVARDLPLDWGPWITVASVDIGPETHEGQAGWVTVKWLNPAVDGLCGRASIGGSVIELNPRRRECSCNRTQGVEPRLVRHEFGHAIGFYHTDDVQDVLFGSTFPCSTRDLRPSARERVYAAITYTRPVGNRDPDTDPQGQAFLEPQRIVVD